MNGDIADELNERADVYCGVVVRLRADLDKFLQFTTVVRVEDD